MIIKPIYQSLFLSTMLLRYLPHLLALLVSTVVMASEAPTMTNGSDSASALKSIPLPTNQVAYDLAAKQWEKEVHLLSGWHRTIKGSNNPSLTIFSGDPIRFGYSGFDPASSYEVRLHFDSDAKRELRLRANDVIIADSVIVEPGKTVDKVVPLPSSANLNGEITLSIETISGTNAVLTDVEILSTNPKPLQALPVPDIKQLPRLSPQPQAVAGCQVMSVDLSGIWKFNPAPPQGFESKVADSSWSDIRVPGEWAMQGFEVKPGTAAGYWRTFTLPKEWAGKRIKLRCDAVYSDSVVWVNGKKAGEHSGGFTPFEIDITDIAKPGEENSIAISALNESVADKLASGSKYACHQLGGITRNLRIFALPEANLSSLQVLTGFDSQYENAKLGVNLKAAQEGSHPLENLVAHLSLTAPDGKPIALSPDLIPLSGLSGSASIPVPSPMKWDNEHPRLYTLSIGLEADGKLVETVTQRVGFRQIEIRGNEMLVNGFPVKLRGVNHHETYPITGRSLPDGQDRKDVELFREGNVNLLRTCHYPPDEALLNAADELGMFIECEAPFCWAPGNGSSDLVCSQTAEMALAYRNHPSVLFWSLANESDWGRQFVESSTLLHRLDPSRPQNFNDDGYKSDPHYTQILNSHYGCNGGPDTPAKGLPQPFYHGEDSHLNSYNRLELATDPALRDIWGLNLRNFWDTVYETSGNMGMSIWAGLDDTFYLKNDQTVGYGTWGPLDGWRREKPEFWNMKKSYSPVRIVNRDKIGVDNHEISIEVENRQNFSNLKEMKTLWKLGDLTGNITSDVPPKGRGVITMKLAHDPKPGEKLVLSFSDPRGFIADRFSIPIGSYPPKHSLSEREGVPAKLTDTESMLTVTSGTVVWQIDRKRGQFITMANQLFLGPQLMLLPRNGSGEIQMKGKTKLWEPFTAPCPGWICTSVSATQDGTKVEVTITGKYDNAEGSYTLIFENGGVKINYDFKLTQAINPRQIGLVFSLPHDFETLSWEREGYWDLYPEDHIARLRGSVKASEGFEATSVGPRTPPQHPWRLDRLPYGNNDFCSTKHNILTASLSNPKGEGIVINGHAKQHVRAWRTAEQVNFLTADFSNSGGASFVIHHDERPLKAGDKVTGTVELEPFPKSL